jgi:hypothetical protein
MPGGSARNSNPYSSALKSYLIAKGVKSAEALFSLKIRSEIKTATQLMKQIAATYWAARLLCSAWTFTEQGRNSTALL